MIYVCVTGVDVSCLAVHAHTIALSRNAAQVLVGDGQKYECGSPNPFAGEEGGQNLASTAYRYDVRGF